MVANTIAAAALILSLVTFWLAQRSARATDRRARIPVLVFVYDDGRWLLRNVGNGPALNINKEYTVQSAWDLNQVTPRRELPRWKIEETEPAWRRELEHEGYL